MNENEVIDLLSIITAYDKRTTGDGELLAWSDAAERGRWTFDEAREAIKAHYAESTEWIMQGHVTTRIKANRSEPPRSSALPAATPRTATEKHRAEVVAWFARHGGRRPDATENRRALTMSCPYCAAEPDRSCWQTATGSPLASSKHITEPHRQRVNAFREKQE